MPRARSRRSSIACPVAVWRFASIDLRLLGIAIDEPFGQAELHRERDELLLRAVVEVAFQLPSLLVLGVDQPLARCAELLDVVHQLLGERHVAHHQTRLSGQVADQLLLGRRDRVPGSFHDRQGAQELALVPDRLPHLRRRHLAGVVFVGGDRRKRLGVVRPRSPPARADPRCGPRRPPGPHRYRRRARRPSSAGADRSRTCSRAVPRTRRAPRRARRARRRPAGRRTAGLGSATAGTRSR